MTDRINALIELIQDKYVISIRENDWKYSHMFEHSDGSYKVIDWGDRDNPIKIDTKDALTDRKCMYILKCQLRPGSPSKLRPFFYFEKGGWEFNSQIEELRANPKIKSTKMFWRGNPHVDREGVLASLGTEYLNNDFMEKRNKNVFYGEMSVAHLVLSLPGLGKACHREFEGFGVGTPVIMPEFKNTYFVDLKPNFHYISVNVDGRDMAEAIKERYHEVVNDKDFLSFVRQNAMTYYDTYIRIDQNVLWMKKLLEL